MKNNSKEKLAFCYFNKCKNEDRKKCALNVNPKLSKDGVFAIAKVLMSSIALEERVATYSSMGKCVECLGKVARVLTWDTEMGKLEGDWQTK